MEYKQVYWTEFFRRNPKVLAPYDRALEILFGVIMALTFTCSIGLLTESDQDIKTMLWSALGCNAAWGLIDGLMLLMTTLYERGQGIRNLRAVKKAKTEKEAEQIILDHISPVISSVMTSEQTGQIRKSLLSLSEPPGKAFLTLKDFWNATLVFLLVFFSTFPLVIPFLIFENPAIALRVSNGIAICFMFTLGFLLGRVAGYQPFLTGLGFMILGVLVVFITIQLGG